MALFDRLVSDDSVTKVIDVGYGSFERFFDIAEQIGIFGERESRSLDSCVLFPTDAHPISAISYARLRRRFESVVVVPIFNEAIAPGKKLRDDFPFIAQLRCHYRFRRSRPCSRRNWSSPIPPFSTFMRNSAGHSGGACL